MIRDDDLFGEALALPAADRDAFLARACADQPEARRRVEKLLRDLESADAFFDRPLVQVVSGASEGRPNEEIGPYVLIEKIGEGGCGVVWRAEQRVPVRREVALKVVKPGMDTREVIARFEAERQALALMDHPHIARVYDGGATVTGRPFFVMEFVRGLPITRYCDEHGLGLSGRIALFLLVCEAVQHAHQKGIIHRDLKPSNILVAERTESGVPAPRPAGKRATATPRSTGPALPVPKVIDFGIAKATQGRLTDVTLRTAVHQIMGTPAYMSPEQALSGGGDIDTRTDVYSLGVVLYELLTGDTPLDRASLVGSGYEEMRERIRTLEPARPSTRLRVRTAGQPRSFGSAELQGDLDWIVMRCLEKERTRRYESVEALAHDLRRHLANEPVSARPPSMAYLFGRMVRRHRGAFGAAAALVAVLAAGVIASTTQAMRATRAERAQSQQRIAAEAARGAEAALRVEAERRRTEEAHRWSRFDFANASRLLEQGRGREGIAFLVHAGQLNPENRAVAVRLLTALAGRAFVRPVEPVTTLPAARLEDQREGRHGNFTRDGLSFGILCADGVYRLISLVNGQIEREIPVGRIATGAEIIGPWLRVTTERRGSEFWELGTGQRAGEWVAPENGTIESVASTADGRWVARVEGDAIRVWEVAARREVLTVRAGVRPRGLNFSPDGGRLVAIARDGTWVKGWEIPGGELRTNIVMPAALGPAINPGLSHDNRTIAVLVRDGVQLFDAATGAARGALMRQPGHRSGNDDPVFTPDNRFVIMAGADRTVQVWRVETGEPAYPSFGHNGAVDRVQVIADGRLLLVPSADGMTHLWDLRTGRAVIEPFEASGGSRTRVSPDGRLVVEITPGREIRRHRIGETAARPTTIPPWPEARTAAWNADRPASWRRIGKQRVREIDLAAESHEREVARLPTAIASVWPAAKGNTWLVRPEVGPWQAWRWEGDRIETVTLAGLESGSPQGSIKLSADGTHAIVCGVPDQRALQVWDLRSGKPAGPVVRVDGPIGLGIGTSDLSADRRLVAAIGGGEARLWEVETGKLVHRLKPLQRNPRGLEFTPDSRHVVMIEFSNGARLWDAATGQPRTAHLQHRGGGDGLFSGGISPDQQRMMTFSSSSGSVVVRNLATGEPSGPELEHGHELLLVPAWSPDGTRVATLGADGIVRVWDITTGAVLAALPCERSVGLPNPRGVGMADPARTHQMSFSADGRFLAVTLRGRPTQVWAAPPPPQGPVPGWLIELATLTVGARVDDDGHVRDVPSEPGRWESVRRTVNALADGAPYAGWGKWLVADPSQRGWAPGVRVANGGEERGGEARRTND